MEDREPYITGGKMRDKFLTEAMGLCYHEIESHDVYRTCILCNESILVNRPITDYNPNFHSWDAFGKLWEWAIEQEWWQKFLNVHDVSPDYRFRGFDVGLIKPDKLADAIYEYLKNRG